MNENTYRACYWQSNDKQAEVVLTSEEQSTLSDDELRAEAVAEAERAGLTLDGGRLIVGEWRE